MRPNDPLYSQQRGLRRVNPEQAWDRVRNIRQAVTIAFLDTGVDVNHPDLRDKIVPGRNFVNPNTPTDVTDNDEHGTRIAGAAAAVTNNRTGIAGMSFNTASIMPVKVLEHFDDNVIPENLSAGIRFAVNNGARVINISTFLTGFGYNQDVQNAIEEAWNSNCVIMAAGGNLGTSQVFYPAGFNRVLAVSAINNNDQKLDFSNYGVDIGIASPGESILTTVPGGGYNNLGSGTSVATAFVSGLAAMLIAANPNLTNRQVLQIIQRSAENLDFGQRSRGRSPGKGGKRSGGSVGWSPIFGYGLINASSAMRLATTSHRSRGRTGRLGSFYGQVVSRFNIPIEARVRAVRGNTASEYTTDNIVTFVDNQGNPQRIATNGMFRLPNLEPGQYTITVSVDDAIRLTRNAEIIGGADTFLRLRIR